ncbi:MAG TPA: hypothetical protein VNA24_17775 [Hyalangium sp.]|jgi:hypothetical protein|nr:hypothetical protein [Hyalangium sp.]
MDSNESKKPSVAQPEPSSADRRTFMKNVMTGTVAAGLVATVGKAEAAPAGADTCGAQARVPRDRPVKATVLLNRNAEITRDQIFEVIGNIFENGGCPPCGLFGWPGGGTIDDIAFEKAYLPEGQFALVAYKDADGKPC